MRLDINSYITDYRGVLGWTTFVDGSGVVRPDIEVPLYIKDHPIPQRKVKFTEISTVQQIDPYSKLDTAVNTLFQTASDILSVVISGFIITPFIGGAWQTKDINGALLFSGQWSYPEMIQHYLEGYMNLNVVGTPQRRDPDYYITPYGQKYLYPQIATFEHTATVNPKKNQFTMQMWLER